MLSPSWKSRTKRTEASKGMTNVLRYDDKYKTRFTQDELFETAKDSVRCGDIDDGVLRFIIPEVPCHGSPNDDKGRFCFETQYEDSRIADSERARAEASQKENPMRWDNKISRFFGGSSSSSGHETEERGVANSTSTGAQRDAGWWSSD